MSWRPSPALIVALVALFVALGGSAVALQGHNSVRSDDIKNGQVKEPDLAGTAAAGKVHRVKANHATTQAADPCQHGRTGVFCGFDNGGSPVYFWSNHGDTFGPASFSKDHTRTVRLSGVVEANSFQTCCDIFILPKGFRPPATRAFDVPCAQNDLRGTDPLEQCEVFVYRNGRVSQFQGIVARGGLSLDPISFRAR